MTEHLNVRLATEADFFRLAVIQWRAICNGIKRGYLPIEELGAGKYVKPNSIPDFIGGTHKLRKLLRLREQYSDTKKFLHHCLVIERNGTIVGGGQILYKFGNDYVCFFSLAIEPHHQNQGFALLLRSESLRFVHQQYPKIRNVLISRYDVSNSYAERHYPPDSLFNQIPRLAVKQEIIDWQGIPVNFYYLSLLSYEDSLKSKIIAKNQQFISSSSSQS